MTSSSRITIFDTTLRDGEQSPGAAMNLEEKLKVATMLDELGEAIMAAAAKGVRPVSFELGGKNAAVVFADADFDKAIAGITRSAFENCGQVCLGTERVYVQRPHLRKIR